MGRKKRALALLLAVVLFTGGISLFPNWAQAAPAGSHTCDTYLSGDAGSGVESAAELTKDTISGYCDAESEVSYSLKAGTYYLSDDLTLEKILSVYGTDLATKQVNLCLNGHSLILNSQDTVSVIIVGSNAILNLYDCKGTGKITGASNAATGGSIGGGVRVNGEFNMYGGNITGNKAYHGGGVHLSTYHSTDHPLFNMYGGAITNNVAVGSSGGIAISNTSATCNIYGGKITGNVAGSKAGGIGFSYGTLSLKGAVEIRNNHVDYYESTGEISSGAVVTLENNLQLDSGNKITLSESLAKGSYVGVTTDELDVDITTGMTVTDLEALGLHSDCSGFDESIVGGALHFTYRYDFTRPDAPLSGDGFRWEKSAKILALDGAVIKNPFGLMVPDGTTISLQGANQVYKYWEDNSHNRFDSGILCKGTLTIKEGAEVRSPATLSANGLISGIFCYELHMDGGALDTMGSSAGILCDNETGGTGALKMSGGSILANGGYYGLTAASLDMSGGKLDTTSKYMFGLVLMEGPLNITGGELHAKAGEYEGQLGAAIISAKQATVFSKADGLSVLGKADDGQYTVPLYWFQPLDILDGLETFVLDASRETAAAEIKIWDASTPAVIRVDVTPSTAEVKKGEARSFRAVVTGENSPVETVVWSVQGQTSPSTFISQDGVLHVGSDETAASLTVTATSVADSAKSGTAAVAVTDLPAEEKPGEEVTDAPKTGDCSPVAWLFVMLILSGTGLTAGGLLLKKVRRTL